MAVTAVAVLQSLLRSASLRSSVSEPLELNEFPQLIFAFFSGRPFFAYYEHIVLPTWCDNSKSLNKPCNSIPVKSEVLCKYTPTITVKHYTDDLVSS